MDMLLNEFGRRTNGSVLTWQLHLMPNLQTEITVELNEPEIKRLAEILSQAK